MWAIYRLSGYAMTAAASLLCGIVLASEFRQFFPKDVETSARYLERISQFELFTAPADNVMVGDSLTERGVWSELLPRISVANRGIGGTTIDLIRQNLSDIPQSADRVFVMAGVNDIANGRKAEEVLADYKGLLTDLSGMGVDIVVQSTLMTSNRKWNGQIAKLDQFLSEFCRQSDACNFVDLNDAMGNQGFLRNDLTYDGIHLNGHGYAIWAQAIAPLMEREDQSYSSPAG